MTPLRLAVVSTHPIQYHAPLFKALAESRTVRPRVFFTWSQTSAAGVVDPGFGKTVAWDIPLLEGYEHEFVPNVARRPGTGHFWGLRNPDLTRRIEGWRADAVLVFGWNSASHLGVMRHFKGRIPVFFRGDSTLLGGGSAWRARVRRTALSWVYRHIDMAIAVGSNNKEYFRWSGVPEERIAFAPHAIDTQRFSDPDGQSAARATRWRTELGIPPSARVILYAGKFTPTKNLPRLVQAFCGAGMPGHLILVGNGLLEAQLRSLASGRGDVHFLPFQNQQAMTAVYRLGNVFTLPSLGETWGLAINEALACGRPVIVSNRVGGTRDLVKDGVNGWIFEASSLDQLTGAVRRALMCEPQTLDAMGEAARRTSADWTLTAAAAGIERAVVTFCANARMTRPAAVR